MQNPINCQTIRRVVFKANDIIYNAKNDCIYATAPSANLSNGNMLCKLESSSGKVLQSIFIGTEPDKMAISDDAQFLYVSFENIPRIVRLKLPELIPDLTIPLLDFLYSSNIYDYVVAPYYITDMKVFPNNPKTLAVALKTSYDDYSRRLVIYDEKKMRPGIGFHPLYLDNINHITFVGKDTSQFVASTPSQNFVALSIAPITLQGIGAVNSNYSNVLGINDRQLEYSARDSLIYTGSKIFNPFSNPPLKEVYSFNIQSASFYPPIYTVANPFEDMLYISYLASDTLKLQQYHSKTRQLIKSWQLSVNHQERHKKITHLGSVGKIAVHTNDNIYLFNNCTSTITTKPVIAQGNTINVCQNDFVTLSVNSTNKVLWSTGDTTSSISVKESGLYAVSFLDAKGCASESSVPISVLQVPLPSSPILSSIDPSLVTNGNASLCKGENLLVSAASTDSSNIKWNTGDISKTILISQSGTYYAISTNKNGCSARSNSIDVVVSPSPALIKPIVKVIGQTEICSPASAVLQAPSGFDNYIWSNGATTQTIYVMPELLDSYAVKVYNAIGCKSPFSDFVKIRRFETPLKPFLVYRDSLLSVLNTPSFTYRWFLNGELLPNINTQTYKPLSNGFYSVQAYNSSCNSPFSDWVNITVLKTRLIDPSVSFIQIYPNPTSEYIRVQILSEQLKTGMLELVNNIGAVCQTMKITDSQNQYFFNLKDYNAGSYFLRWKSDDGKIYGFKMIVKL